MPLLPSGEDGGLGASPQINGHTHSEAGGSALRVAFPSAHNRIKGRPFGAKAPSGRLFLSGAAAKKTPSVTAPAAAAPVPGRSPLFAGRKLSLLNPRLVRVVVSINRAGRDCAGKPAPGGKPPNIEKPFTAYSEQAPNSLRTAFRRQSLVIYGDVFFISCSEGIRFAVPIFRIASAFTIKNER